jgi:mitochondrial fission protein ELM1
VVCFSLSPDESYGRVLRKFSEASIHIFSNSFKTIPNRRADDVIAACDRGRYSHSSSTLAALQQNTIMQWAYFDGDPNPVSSYIASTAEYLLAFRTRVLFPSSGSSTLLRLLEPEDGASTIRRVLL